MKNLRLLFFQPEVVWFLYLYILNGLGLFEPGVGEFVGRFFLLSLMGPVLVSQISKPVLRGNTQAVVRFGVLSFVIFLIVPWIPFVSRETNWSDSALIMTQIFSSGFSFLGALVLMLLGWLVTFFTSFASVATFRSFGHFSKNWPPGGFSGSKPRDVSGTVSGNDFVEVKAERIES